jgi:tetratricopeptide (TPR) repeat protein
MLWRVGICGLLLGVGGTLAVQGLTAPEVTNLPQDLTAAEALARREAEIARMAEELARRKAADPGDASADREQVSSTQAAEASGTPLDRTTKDLLELLLGELRDLLHCGHLLGIFAEHPAGLANMVLQAWLSGGQPERALHLLRLLHQFKVQDLESHTLLQISQQLLEQGDRVHAKEALELVLRLQPGFWDAAANLARLAPEAGLQLVTELLAGQPDAEQSQWLRGQQALFLIAAKRGREALALRKDAPQPENGEDEDDTAGALDQALVEFDPKLAVDVFNERLAKEYSAETDLLRAHALKSLGKRNEALAIATKLLETEIDNDGAWETMVDLDQQQALRFVQDQATRQPGLTVALRRATLLADMKRGEEAAGALEEAWQYNPQRTAYAMLQLDAGRFGSRVQELARQRKDDELIGDLGDAAWHQGRQREAIGYWREAQAMDPSDGEWRNKVRSAELGRDPFGNR